MVLMVLMECRPSWSLAGVVVVICSGLVLLVAGETRFDLVMPAPFLPRGPLLRSLIPPLPLSL